MDLFGGFFDTSKFKLENKTRFLFLYIGWNFPFPTQTHKVWYFQIFYNWEMLFWYPFWNNDNPLYNFILVFLIIFYFFVCLWFLCQHSYCLVYFWLSIGCQKMVVQITYLFVIFIGIKTKILNLYLMVCVIWIFSFYYIFIKKIN
jgi:hypothetical protein